MYIYIYIYIHTYKYKTFNGEFSELWISADDVEDTPLLSLPLISFPLARPTLARLCLSFLGLGIMLLYQPLDRRAEPPGR
jgi:hypothetical protein